ncbi:MAG: hypothetical protein Q7U74_08170 [Saprospiraceae bacterium]|nr:hypothetical protein [Saprospiraceae bacterium]
MTQKELMIETIAKATGKPIAACETLLLETEQGRKILTWPAKTLPDAEVEILRAQFENEMPGILAWLSREIMIQQPPKGTA